MDKDLTEVELIVDDEETYKIGYWVSEGLNTRVCVEVYEGPKQARDYDAYLKKDESPEQAAVRGFKSFLPSDASIAVCSAD